jgi:shikimate kinase
VKADKVYLVGFMGAGKTTLARALAQRLHWQVEDIDERVERREHRDIPAIFRQEGEAYFRAVEREELVGLLTARGAVVATRGGT